MHARLVVAYLVMCSLVYAAIGVAGLLAPRWLMSLVAIDLAEAGAVNEIRAAYGGQMLGLAVIIALGSRRPGARRSAVALFLAAVGGMLLARVLSLALDGTPTTAVWVLGAMELSAVLAGAALLSTWPGGDAPAIRAAS